MSVRRVRGKSVGSSLGMLAIVGATSAAVIGAACGSSDKQKTFTTSGGGSGGSGQTSTGTSAGGHGGKSVSSSTAAVTIGAGGTTTSSTGTGTISPDAACAMGSVQATLIPLNIFIVWDQSGSMGDPTPTGTKWTDTTGALKTFITDPGSAGLRVALRFFPDGPNNIGFPNNCGYVKGESICDTDSNIMDPNSCTTKSQMVQSCSLPSVPLSELTKDPAPMDMAEDALVKSIDAHCPTGGTPMWEALAGAERFAQQYQALHKNEKTVVVLVTDGDPNGCKIDLVGDFEPLVAAALANLGIHTYTLGLQGSNPGFMDGIANAGGTMKSFTIGNGNAAADLLKAFHQIQSEGVGCVFQVPTSMNGMKVDPGQVNVNYTPSMGQLETLPEVNGPGDCAANQGWYYDNPKDPTTITLCPASCQTVQADPTAKLDIILGCKSEIH